MGIERVSRGKRGNPKFYFLKFKNPANLIFETPFSSTKKNEENTAFVMSDGKITQFKINHNKEYFIVNKRKKQILIISKSNGHLKRIEQF